MRKTRRVFLKNAAAISVVAMLPFPAFNISRPEPTANALDFIAMQKPKLLIFDVNETLLDLSNMKASINKALDHESAFNQWFSFMLQYSLVDTVTGNYHDFGAIGKAAMEMTQEKLKRDIPAKKVQEFRYDQSTASPSGCDTGASKAQKSRIPDDNPYQFNP